MNARSGALIAIVSLVGACGDDGDSSTVDGGGVDGAVRELVVERVEDLGRFPEPSTTVVGRDGGPGGRLGDRLLWTFGDTFLGARNPVDDSNVLSATAGWSSLDAPLALVQPVDSGGFPAQLIPYTAAELAQNRAAPLDGWALWPGMMIDTGAAEGLVTFQRIKRTNGSGFDSMGVGTARIAKDATVATRDAADLFAPPEPLFMPQSVIDGQVYAMACDQVGFLNVGCKLGRAPVADAGVRAAYAFFDGTTWQQLQPTQVPPRRVFPAMTFDPRRGRVVLFGGLNAGGPLDDTWEWTGTDWELIEVSGQVPLLHDTLFEKLTHKWPRILPNWTGEAAIIGSLLSLLWP